MKLWLQLMRTRHETIYVIRLAAIRIVLNPKG
jgi:hypothetical protein